MLPSGVEDMYTWPDHNVFCEHLHLALPSVVPYPGVDEFILRDAPTALKTALCSTCVRLTVIPLFPLNSNTNSKGCSQTCCSLLLSTCNAAFRVTVALTLQAPVHTDWRHWIKSAYWTSCAHNDNESRLPPQHEIITTSPYWPPGVMKIHPLQCFLSLTPSSHSPICS